jgi:hypothetical protein
MVLIKSSMTMNRILKQQKPHNPGTENRTRKLWIVELIHRRRCDKKTAHCSGAVVQAFASRINLVLNLG